MTPNQNYIVKDQVHINAGKELLWKVLTHTAYIKKWDDVPETYKGTTLTPDAVLNWEGHAKMTVIKFDVNKQLTFDLFLPKVSLTTDQYQVHYSYRIEDNNGSTILNIEIGDFATLPNPDEYYDATVEFVEKAKKTIKALAENI
jgi:hypothetical protein